MEKFIIKEGGQGEIVEKKSRFIATVLPIDTEEEALQYIEKIKKKYWDARHNCFAFVIGSNNEIQRLVMTASHRVQRENLFWKHC